MSASARRSLLLSMLGLLFSTVGHSTQAGAITEVTHDGSDGTPIATGIALRYLPVGWFEMPDLAQRDFRAYPALGLAMFADYRLHRYFSAGLSPEITLNVIPNRADYSNGRMFALLGRLQAHYPTRIIEFFGIATGGYSVIWRSSGADSASGPILGVSLGLRLRFAKRHAVFSELGYQKGFQRADGEAYSPSYVTTGAGWQVRF